MDISRFKQTLINVCCNIKGMIHFIYLNGHFMLFVFLISQLEIFSNETSPCMVTIYMWTLSVNFLMYWYIIALFDMSLYWDQHPFTVWFCYVLLGLTPISLYYLMCDCHCIIELYWNQHAFTVWFCYVLLGPVPITASLYYCMIDCIVLFEMYGQHGLKVPPPPISVVENLHCIVLFEMYGQCGLKVPPPSLHCILHCITWVWNTHYISYLIRCTIELSYSWVRSNPHCIIWCTIVLH